MILGKQYNIFRVLKDASEIDESDIPAYACILRIKNEKDIGAIAFTFIDSADERYFKDDSRENRKLEIGAKFLVQRWDWNGSPEEETVEQITKINNHSCKITTKNGSVKFNTEKDKNATYFKWNKRAKNKWIREYMCNVDFSDYYIDTDDYKKKLSLEEYEKMVAEYAEAGYAEVAKIALERSIDNSSITNSAAYKKLYDITFKEISTLVIREYGIFVFNGEEDKFNRWMEKPNPQLKSKSPNDLMTTLAGIETVKKLLDKIEYGNFS